MSVKRAHEISGFGLALAFFAACIGIDGTGQWLFFAFGISWGRMLDVVGTLPVEK